MIDEKEKEIAKQTLRIAKNTFQLLQQGIFGGNTAQALFESQQWVDGLVKEIETKIPKEELNGTEEKKQS